MKKIICKFIGRSLAVYILIYTGVCLAQQDTNWKWIHPAPQGNNLRWCKIWNTNTWYAAGEGGVFMKTTNGGLNWFVNPWAGFYNPVGGYSQIIYGANFFNQNTGILAGYGNLRRTTDGGTTFNDIPNTLSGWSSIYFFNSNTGYVTAGNIGSTPRLLKTTDGGNTWAANTTISSTNSYWGLYTYDDTTIVVLAANGYIDRSTDRGVTWNMASTGAGIPFWKMNFMNRDTGFICGNNGSVRWTTDGGLNWTGVNNITTRTFYDIEFGSYGNNTAVYVTGDPKYIFRSTDLGASWDTIGILAPNQINIDNVYMSYLASDFIGNDSLITVGNYGYINKRFGANDRMCYTQRIKNGFGTYAVVKSIWAQDSGESNIWAVGSSGLGGNQYVPYDQIMYSSNGGSTWAIQPSGTSVTLNSIYMVNANSGYIAGANGLILKTTNTGNNWITLNPPTSAELRKTFFVDVNTGWVFGTVGAIFKTTDGGLNWVSQSGPGVNINSAFMLDANTGWIVGDNGMVNKTTDGGANWATQMSGTGGILHVIKMLNSNTGYLCGGNGVIIKTINGGINWNALASPVSWNFHSLDFSDSLNGIVTSDVGGIYRTTNGGQSWIIFNTYSEGSIYSSYMVSSGKIFVGGDYAGILKYQSVNINGITEWQNTIPKENELYQNYPNPFNPSTIIKFSVPKAGIVTLIVYDITGKEVATILNNIHLNAGTVTQTFDGSNVSSGVYFYSLFIDGNREATKRMVLLK